MKYEIGFENEKDGRQVKFKLDASPHDKGVIVQALVTSKKLVKQSTFFVNELIK